MSTVPLTVSQVLRLTNAFMEDYNARVVMAHEEAIAVAMGPRRKWLFFKATPLTRGQAMRSPAVKEALAWSRNEGCFWTDRVEELRAAALLCGVMSKEMQVDTLVAQLLHRYES